MSFMSCVRLGRKGSGRPTNLRFEDYLTRSDRKHVKGFPDFEVIYEEDSQGNCVPVITLDVMSDSTDSCEEPTSNEPQSNEDGAQENAGVHFLSERTQDEAIYEFSDSREKEHDSTKEPRQKLESLEYRTRSDGSVVCKLCGEILQSRTHWYRHKYKMHIPSALQPAPLYQCEQCLAFFKSRKGYLGHMASRHSEVLTDSNTTQANAQTEKPTNDQQPAPQQQQLQQHIQQQIHQQQIQQQFQQQQLQQHLLQQQQQRLQQNQQDKRLTDEVNVRSLHDLVITKVPTNQQPVQRQGPSKPVEQKKTFKNIKTPVEMALTTGPGCEEKRIQEEKLVSEIIDRVRKECEAQGSGGSARRGYNRRTTVMHT